jgi:hypothetical protein
MTTADLLAMIADPAATRATVAAGYADGLARIDEIDWPAVNKAILAKWSPSGLACIKARAWRMGRRG